MLASLVLVALAPQSSMPTGAQVLQRTQAAYDAVKTIEQKVEGAISEAPNRGTAHISFSRPGRLRVVGKASMGGTDLRYELLCDGKSTWVYNAGQWQKVENPEMGIATVTGVSANAATVVPATLFHTTWGSATALQKGPLKVARDMVKGRSTYRIEAESPFQMKVWVDARTHFFVRTETTIQDRTITVNFAPPKVNQPIPASRFKR